MSAGARCSDRFAERRRRGLIVFVAGHHRVGVITCDCNRTKRQKQQNKTSAHTKNCTYKQVFATWCVWLPRDAACGCGSLLPWRPEMLPGNVSPSVGTNSSRLYQRHRQQQESVALAEHCRVATVGILNRRNFVSKLKELSPNHRSNRNSST